MSPDERRLLEEAVTLARENNQILRQWRRGLWWGRIYTIIRWGVFVAITLGAYYYLQPYLIKLLDLYQKMFSQVQSLQQTSQSVSANLPDLSGLLEGLKR